MAVCFSLSLTIVSCCLGHFILSTAFGINSILYQRGIYPPETFTRVTHYDMSLQLTTDSKLKNYLTNVVSQLKGSLSGLLLCVFPWRLCYFFNTTHKALYSYMVISSYALLFLINSLKSTGSVHNIKINYLYINSYLIFKMCTTLLYLNKHFDSRYSRSTIQRDFCIDVLKISS